MLDRPREADRELPRAFTHLGFWLALCVLLLNDHVLKGSGIVPGWLTGKLSDVAGVLVAPPLLAAALGAGRRHLRLLALAIVGTGLALVKLCPEAARGTEHMLALAGLRSHICVDPSDLWALLALPLAELLCRPWTGARTPMRAPSRDWVARAGIALASIACLATAGVSTKKTNGARQDAPSIQNDSSQTLALVIASTEGVGGCSLYRDDRVALLTGDAFSAAREVMIDAGARLALPLDTSTTPCGAASVELSDGTQARVFWRGLDEIPAFVPADDPRRKKRLLTVSGKVGHFVIDLGDDLQSFELGGSVPDSTCAQSDAQYTLEATPLSMAQGFLDLSEIRHADDGCLEVDWFMGEGDTSVDTQRLCVPDWAFPFDPGETLSVTQEMGAGGEHSLRFTRFSGSAISLQLLVWNDAATFPTSSITGLTAVDCVGTRSDCGAYVRPVEVSVHGKSSHLQSGDDITITGTSPKSTRILVGAARDVAWSSASCTGPEALIGSTANALELRTY
ncbi:MAG: hypothetical protein ACHQ53_00235 [Polyangiales bacterium]